MLSFKLKLSLLVFGLFPVLVSLGLWQLSRYHQKLSLEQVYDARRYLAPLSFSDVRSYIDPLFLPVEISGHYISDKYFLLDNQIHNGQPGYDLLMPFKTASGELLLVNRGWLPLVSREALPDVSTPQGNLVLEGSVYRALGESFLLAEDLWRDGWPKVIQSLDFSKAAAVLGQNLPELTVILSELQPGAEQVRPVSINTKSEKHLAYAVQWFAMALVLIVLYLFRMKQARTVPVKKDQE